MLISPIMMRPNVTAVRKTEKVNRAARTIDDDAPPEEREQDVADGKPKRRAAPMEVPTDAGARSSNAVLSALIDLQERR
jgi:hypothetical protein